MTADDVVVQYVCSCEDEEDDDVDGCEDVDGRLEVDEDDVHEHTPPTYILQEQLFCAATEAAMD